ncbi:MAG TPA: sigma-E factor negative regulatory protein [Rhodanobacteraceae bacterium]|nr:sigma-E factor negative regulatory protein [Rhodanobacteraceae bacterium]
MNDVSKEQLSALMDGELAADEARFLLRRLQHEPEMVGAWSRYHVFRDCLRGQLLVSAATDGFAARVMQQTAAPRPVASPHSRAWRWLRYGMGGTIAASVAVVALVSMRPAANVAPRADGLTASSAAVAASPAPAMGQATRVASADIADSTQPPPLLRARSPLLDVEPASATRTTGYYMQPLTFDRPSPPRWIVQHQQRQAGLSAAPLFGAPSGTQAPASTMPRFGTGP